MDCGRGNLELSLSMREIGRWSKNEDSRTDELEMGTSGVAGKRSGIEADELEERIGEEIG